MSSQSQSIDEINRAAYVCGSCGKTVMLSPSQQIACDHCGFHILYKKRTKAVVEFEAR